MGLFARFKKAIKSRINGTEMVVLLYRVFRRQNMAQGQNIVPRAKPKGNILSAGLILPEDTLYSSTTIEVHYEAFLWLFKNVQIPFYAHLVSYIPDAFKVEATLVTICLVNL